MVHGGELKASRWLVWRCFYIVRLMPDLNYRNEYGFDMDMTFKIYRKSEGAEIKITSDRASREVLLLVENRYTW